MKRTLHLGFVVIVMLTVGIVAAFAGKNGDLEVTISFEKSVYGPNESIPVKVQITNTGRRAEKILRWFTPVDGVEEPLFSVTVDGKVVQYIGARYKRPEPTNNDYIVIQPGRSISAAADLSAYYDLSASGNYTVKYDVSSLVLFDKNTSILSRTQSLTSDDIAASIAGREMKLPPAEGPDAVVGATSFTKCKANQMALLTTARTEASNYSQGAWDYLLGTTPSSTPRYTSWFGAFTSGGWSTVTNHFFEIDSAMDNANVGFNCGCHKPYYAYVFPNQPYAIYLCKVFWTAPMTGTDSKAGTLIHEMSHFSIVAGTDDWAYGQAAARALALSDPSKAIDNADNHEYFAENNPFEQ